MMLLLALVLRPLPEEVVDHVGEFAHELDVDEGMIPVARRFASGVARARRRRLRPQRLHRPPGNRPMPPRLHTSVEIREAWDAAVNDAALAARWEALEHLPPESLGRLVWQLYHARGFEFPGRPGSAPPLLSQHDWVHVLADYGTTVEAELEVFAFIARANDDMRAFSLLAMVVSLFETGYLRTGADLFESDLGHLSAAPGVATRMADAMSRGAWCSRHGDGIATASTSCASTGSRWLPCRSTRSAPASRCDRSPPPRSPPGPPATRARRHQPVPAPGRSRRGGRAGRDLRRLRRHRRRRERRLDALSHRPNRSA